MKKPGSVKSLEELGRIRLSDSFFMRDFLYSEISNFHGIQNFPDDPERAIQAGKKLCEFILEPLQQQFGRISIRSSYRAPAVNRFGNENKLNCSANEKDPARHIWDRLDKDGNMGALACIIVNRFIPYYETTSNWQALAWWIHDHLPYSEMVFFPKFAAVNIAWNEMPKRTIKSYIPPNRGHLTKPGAANHNDNHKVEYAAMLASMAAYSN